MAASSYPPEIAIDTRVRLTRPVEIVNVFGDPIIRPAGTVGTVMARLGDVLAVAWEGHGETEGPIPIAAVTPLEGPCASSG